MLFMKVLVAGTFDLLHPGHLRLLREAKRRGELHVVVARDSNSEKAKGHPPLVSEGQRLEMVKALKPVDRAMLGSEDDLFSPVEEIRPDVILLGPDQEFPGLEQRLRESGLSTRVERLEKRAEDFPLASSSAIRERAEKPS